MGHSACLCVSHAYCPTFELPESVTHTPGVNLRKRNNVRCTVTTNAHNFKKRTTSIQSVNSSAEVSLPGVTVHQVSVLPFESSFIMRVRKNMHHSLLPFLIYHYGIGEDSAKDLEVFSCSDIPPNTSLTSVFYGALHPSVFVHHGKLWRTVSTPYLSWKEASFSQYVHVLVFMFSKAMSGLIRKQHQQL